MRDVVWCGASNAQHAACTLHACCMHAACLLHARCMHTWSQVWPRWAHLRSQGGGGAPARGCLPWAAGAVLILIVRPARRTAHRASAAAAAAASQLVESLLVARRSRVEPPNWADQGQTRSQWKAQACCAGGVQRYSSLPDRCRELCVVPSHTSPLPHTQAGAPATLATSGCGGRDA